MTGVRHMPVSDERLRVLRANNEESHRETRECIKGALVALLLKKPYDDITMTDIIRKSGVSRSGVYKNYKSKADIMLEVYGEPINEVVSALGTSIFENMEIIFRTGKQHEKAFKAILGAGLEHRVLDIMNDLYEDASVSFYIPLWVGMIYNAFFEWIKAGMDEPVEEAIARVKVALELVATSIENGLTNSTQNKLL